MNAKCLLLGLMAFWMATRAEDGLISDRHRKNRANRRYQPKTALCSRCQPQHRHLLFPPGGPKSSRLKKCFSSSEIKDSAELRTVLPKSSPETFVLVIPMEDSVLEPELLTVMAEILGNVSVLVPENSSMNGLSNRCRSLGTVCFQLNSLIPILEQVRTESGRDAIKSVFGLWGEGEEDEFPFNRQLERLMGELCKRDKARNKLIEIRKGPRNEFPYNEDLKSGLSLKDILPLDSKSYDKNRPPKLGGQPTVVYFHVTVLSLDSINEESMTYVADIFLAQTWQDPRLRLPENMSQQYRILDVDWLHDIWRPDCFFKNAKQVTFHEISIPNHYVWLYHDKTLLYMSKLTLVLSCAMKFESYPHDIQVCSMMIESLSHTVQDLVFLWNTTDPLVVNDEIELPQLDIASNYTTDCTVHYSTGNFTCLAVVFTLKRRLGYHLLHTYIPSALIVVMSWISFWIKPEAIPARVTLGVTSLLTLATQNTQSQQSLPPVSYVKAIDIWMSSCSVFVFLSLMEFAIVNNYMGPIAAKGIIGYSDEDLRAVNDCRMQTSVGKEQKSPTCYDDLPSANITAIFTTDNISVISRILMTKSVAKPQSKLQEAKKKLEEILREASQDGCSPLDLAPLPSARRLLLKSAGHSECRRQSSGCRAFLFVAAAVAAVAYVTNTHTLQGFSSFWLKWNYGSVNDELCTIRMPDEVSKIFRPPVPCSMCQGVTKVEKLSNLSPEVFGERYAYTGRPVIVTDGTANWTAQHVFGFEFFKKIYSRRMDEWRLHNCQFFPYNTEFRHLGEVFGMADERALMAEGTEPWYVGWSNCDDEINQILRRHYTKPYFLPETAETKTLDWIFMGSSGYGAPMHVDNVEHPSWQAQLRGRKKWTLQPPPECFYVCENVEVVVEPGEIIVLDTNRWYHSTLIVSKEMSVTIGAEYD